LEIPQIKTFPTTMTGMKAEIKPTENPEKLVDNLKKRVESVEKRDGKVIVEISEDKLDMIERTPGVELFKANGEEKQGLKGRPIQEDAYAKLETREDFAKAVLATIQGYDLKVLETEREWDLKLLRRFNPDIKQLKHENPPSFLEISKTLDSSDSEREDVSPEVSKKDIEMIYSFATPEKSSETHE